MLYILRHGITEWNEEKRLQGRTDIPLNEKGRQMARDAAEEYKDVHFDVCYASPLIRAKETAELVIGDRNIPIIYDDRLKEIGFGEYEGSVGAFKIEGSSIRKFFKAPEEYIPDKGGESLEELFARTGEFLNEVVYKDLKEGKDVLIVGHGAMNSSIICQVLGRSVDRLWEMGIENCKLYNIESYYSQLIGNTK